MKKIMVLICIPTAFLFSGDGEAPPSPENEGYLPGGADEERLIVFEEEFDEGDYSE